MIGKVKGIGLCFLEVPIVGITPVLTNRFHEEVIRGIEEKQAGQGRNGKKPRDPEKEFRLAMHLNEDGKPGIPGIAFKKACVRASKSLNYKMTDVNAALFIDQDLVLIEADEPVMRRDPVRMQNTINISYRPEFSNWSAKLRMSIDTSVLTPQEALTILRKAGFTVGVGAWRPENSGYHGRFAVDGEKAIATTNLEQDEWSIAPSEA